MRFSPQSFVALALCLAAGGCMLGPDFVPPDPHLPEISFFGKAKPATVLVEDNLPRPTDPAWWRVFRDPVLTGLEEKVAAQNLDVKTATVRLAESRFQRGVAAAAEFPGLNASDKYQRELYSKNGIISLLGGLLGAPGGSVPISAINDYTVGFDASWELDLWGRVRRQVEAADAQVDQAAEQRRDALVSSLAELARDYIQLRGTQVQIRIANENIKADQDILGLTRTRQQKGLTTGLDVENAAAQVESVRAQVPALEQQQTQYINALSLLLDEPPGTLNGLLVRARGVPLGPPRVPTGIPSELARRRPDIRAAEAQLHAATANIGVAVASFYPTVQLNGSVGFDSLDIKNLWKGSSLQYNFGPSVSLPLFDAGRLKGTLELREAQQQEAAIAYHKTVLQSWHDIVNALVAYRLEQRRRERLNAEVGHSRAALSLARSRYDQGVADFLTVLDGERTLLQAELQAAQSTTNVSLYLVQLYKALGGGWELTFPDPRTTIPPTETVAAAPPVVLTAQPPPAPADR
jgi:NodT family efflux transporter outer membrane factor (OMF) lipoprotein